MRREKTEYANYSYRLVSMPCCEKFDIQDENYKNNVIPSDAKNIITIEAGSGLSWYKYIKNNGKVISIDTYGASGKAQDLFEHFGFTVERVLDVANELLDAQQEF